MGIIDYFFDGGDDRAQNAKDFEKQFPKQSWWIKSSHAHRSKPLPARAKQQKSFWASNDPKDKKKQDEYKKATKDRANAKNRDRGWLYWD